jgi:hypothetical protein
LARFIESDDVAVRVAHAFFAIQVHVSTGVGRIDFGWCAVGESAQQAAMAALNTIDLSEAAQLAGQKAVSDYLTVKATPASVRTPAQADLMNTTLNPKLGFNLDAWDGYVAAHEALHLTSHQLQKRLVVLAGDSHNAWHSDLTLMGLAKPALAGTKVGEESQHHRSVPLASKTTW